MLISEGIGQVSQFKYMKLNYIGIRKNTRRTIVIITP